MTKQASLIQYYKILNHQIHHIIVSICVFSTLADIQPEDVVENKEAVRLASGHQSEDLSKLQRLSLIVIHLKINYLTEHYIEFDFRNFLWRTTTWPQTKTTMPLPGEG